MIASSVHPVVGPVARTLSVAPLRGLGVISYGLYLWHWPVYLVLTPVRTGLDGWALVALRVSVSIAFAIASYFCIEMPIRRGVWAGWRVRALTPAVALVAVLAVVLATASAVTHVGVSASAARAAAAPLSSTVTPGTLRVLVAGDSVAYHLGESFVRLDPELGFSTANVAFDGCALEQGATAARYFDGSDAYLDGQDCTAGWADAVTRFDPDVVVVVLAGQVLGDWQVGGEWVHLCDPGYDAWYASPDPRRRVDPRGAGCARRARDTAVVHPAVGASRVERADRLPGEGRTIPRPWPPHARDHRPRVARVPPRRVSRLHRRRPAATRRPALRGAGRRRRHSVDRAGVRSLARTSAPPSITLVGQIPPS